MLFGELIAACSEKHAQYVKKQTLFWRWGYIPERRNVQPNNVESSIFFTYEVIKFPTSLADKDPRAASENNVNPSPGNVRRMSGQ